MFRALVTGANGFVGSHLVEKLIREGVEVHCLVRHSSNLQWIDTSKVICIYGDIADYSSLIPAVQDVDVVYHLAGKTTALNESEYERINVQGTKNLVGAVKQHHPRIKRFLFVSSQAAGGPSRKDEPIDENSFSNPVTPYGKSKLSAENVLESCRDQIPLTIIRASSVFGPRDKDFLMLFKLIHRGIIPMLGFKERIYSLVYVQDLVDGIWQASIHPDAINQMYYLASPESISWKQFCLTIGQALGKKGVSVYLPMSLFVVVLTIMDLLSKIKRKSTVMNVSKIPEFIARYWECRSQKAKHDFDFKSQNTLAINIEETVNWYRDQSWL